LIPDESYKKSSNKEKYDHEMKYEYYFRHCSSPLELRSRIILSPSGKKDINEAMGVKRRSSGTIRESTRQTNKTLCSGTLLVSGKRFNRLSLIYNY
jgi:hypothetical protein